MKTIKPLKLSLLTRCYEFERRCHLGVSILGFVPTGSVAELRSEMAMWKFVASELGKDAAVDGAIPKKYSEYLITGRAFAPGGEAKKSFPVRAQLGSHEKVLLVQGDRQWRILGPTDPEPFIEMPLDWAHAFGGEGYAINPSGKGFSAITVGDEKVQPLPNVEYLTQLMTQRGKHYEPASFGPVDLMLPQRSSKAGTHDERWLKEDFPGFARDIDWRFFNIAPADQQFERPFKGDETYVLENMHPSKRRIEGRLPGILARCFITRRAEEIETFEEVPTALTTVWFFPHAEHAVLIFQGSVLLQDEDAADLLQIVIGAEAIGQPKGSDHYRAVLAERLDKKKGGLASLRDSDLLPAGMATPDPSIEAEASLNAREGLLKRNLRRRAEREILKARAFVQSHGLDPDKHAPPLLPAEESLPDLDGMPAYIERMMAEAERRKKELAEKIAAEDKVLEALFSSLGMDFEAVRKEQTKAPAGPPKLTVAWQRQLLEGLIAQGRSLGVPTLEMEQMLVDPGTQQQWVDGEKRLNEAYRMSAHHQAPAPRRQANEAQEIRIECEAARARGESFARKDLTGADLSGLDLKGADFEDAFLESVNFAGSNLEGANLKGAVLAHASLENARLGGACLAGANLGGAKLCAVNADGADFTRAVLARADLTGASFREATLERADLSEAIFTDADFSGARAPQTIFMESDLRGVTLAGAKLEKGMFIRTDVTGVDFTGAVLSSALFLGARGRGAKFGGAEMKGVQFVEQCDFEAADMAAASLTRANLRGTLLGGCNLTEARLDDADLSESDLRKARLYRATARRARFVKADMSGSVMTSIDAAGASLQRANICGADLRGANLYQADFARIHMDEGTRLEDALMHKVRIYPKRST